VLRTTTNSPELVREVENQVGRKVEVRIGGLSNQGLMALHDATVASLVSAGKQLGRYPTSEVIPDAQLGEVRIQINSEDLIAAKPVIPPGVTVERIADLKPFPAASFAGTEYNPGCTVGYMARDFSNLKYVVTAAHCPNLPSSSYGSSHTNVYSEACATIDTQAVRTSATTVWSGFYDYYGQWSNITAVAGGWFNNQPFDRRGRFTTAVGTVTNPTTITVSGGDCGSYPVYAFPLTNTAGSSVVGGDSGGPLMLIYNNQYYLAGQTTSVGVVSNGRSAWRSVPSGLVACTYPASQGLGC
jgi:hypothetical protein